MTVAATTVDIGTKVCWRELITHFSATIHLLASPIRQVRRFHMYQVAIPLAYTEPYMLLGVPSFAAEQVVKRGILPIVPTPLTVNH